jgi:hypothetical protein
MRGALFIVGFVAILLGLVLPAANIGYAGAQTLQPVTGESVTVDYDSPVAVDQEAGTYSDSVTVRNATGSELAAGTDYTWDASAGELSFSNTSNTTDGESANIDYSYEGHSQTDKNIDGVLSNVGGWIGLLLLLVAVATLVAMLGGGF